MLLLISSRTQISQTSLKINRVGEVLCLLRADISILAIRLILVSKKKVIENNNVVNSGFGYFKL